MIKVFDKFGREMQITAQYWFTKVLPDHLQRCWDKPSELYDALVMALRDGFEKEPDIFKAAKRLYELEPDQERSATIFGIVLMKQRQLTKVQELYESFLKRHPDAPYLTTNLAKVYSQLGDQKKSEATLWRALTLDPNQDNAVGWWAALHRERGGDEAYLFALRQVAEIPGSWYAQTLLASQLLRTGQKDEAMQVFRDLVAHHPENGSILMSFSGEFGKAGMYDPIFHLVLPIYDPQKHGPMPGFNILQAYVDTKDYQRGEAFLHRMYSLARPDLKAKLDFYSAKFTELKMSASSFGPVAPEEKIEVTALNLERPVWYYDLKNPTWLLPEPKSQTRVCFLPLANASSDLPKEIHTQPIDDAGRLTRAIPMWLAECLQIEQSVPAQTLISIYTGKGVVVMGTDWTDADVDRFSHQSGDAEFVVTGEITFNSPVWKIVLRLWRARPAYIDKTFETTFDFNQIGTGLEQLKSVLWHALGLETTARVAFPTEQMGEYLAALDQSLSLLLAERGAIPPSTLWGERNMLNYFLNLSLSVPLASIPKLLFLSGLIRNRAYGSELYMEFRTPLLAMLEDAKPKSDFYYLSPLAYQLLGMNDSFAARREELITDRDPKVQGWLQGLDQQK